MSRAGEPTRPHILIHFACKSLSPPLAHTSLSISPGLPPFSRAFLSLSLSCEAFPPSQTSSPSLPPPIQISPRHAALFHVVGHGRSMKGVDGLRRPCQCLIDHGVVNAPPFIIVGRYRWPLFTSSRSSYSSPLSSLPNFSTKSDGGRGRWREERRRPGGGSLSGSFSADDSFRNLQKLMIPFLLSTDPAAMAVARWSRQRRRWRRVLAAGGA